MTERRCPACDGCRMVANLDGETLTPVGPWSGPVGDVRPWPGCPTGVAVARVGEAVPCQECSSEARKAAA